MSASGPRSPALEPARYCSTFEKGGTRLRIVLREAQRFGFLGPSRLFVHVGSAQGFLVLVRSCLSGLPNSELTGPPGGPAPARCADLGSGGGVPGLIVATALSTARFTLMEASRKRADFLCEASEFLGISDRVDVVCDRAEVVGRDPAYRQQFDVVMARSFGPPAVVAECGGALLRAGGHLIVSEPPQEPWLQRSPSDVAPRAERWPPEKLEQLGLCLVGTVSKEAPGTGRFSFVVLGKVDETPDRFPRRVGIPAKRPLWA